MPLDPGAEELPRPHLARHRLIRDDADAQPGFHHRLDDLDVFRVHHDGWLDVFGGEEAVDDLAGGRSHLEEHERQVGQIARRHSAALRQRMGRCRHQQQLLSQDRHGHQIGLVDG